jgi:hypothetical protein
MLNDICIEKFLKKLQYISYYAKKGYVITYIGNNKYMMKSMKQYK